MANSITPRRMTRDTLIQLGALCWLLMLGGLALAGPSGVLAWGETLAVLQQREQRIADLKDERAELRNRVNLLDPNSADPDLVSELIRKNLNVVHPDEYIIELDDN